MSDDLLTITDGAVGRLRLNRPEGSVKPNAPAGKEGRVPVTTLRRTGGVADACQLSCRLQRPRCVVWSAVRVRLTAAPIRL